MIPKVPKDGEGTSHITPNVKGGVNAGAKKWLRIKSHDLGRAEGADNAPPVRRYQPSQDTETSETPPQAPKRQRKFTEFVTVTQVPTDAAVSPREAQEQTADRQTPQEEQFQLGCSQPRVWEYEMGFENTHPTPNAKESLRQQAKTTNLRLSFRNPGRGNGFPNQKAVNKKQHPKKKWKRPYKQGRYACNKTMRGEIQSYVKECAQNRGARKPGPSKNSHEGERNSGIDWHHNNSSTNGTQQYGPGGYASSRSYKAHYSEQPP